MKNINLGGTLYVFTNLCSTKIERLLSLKFLKNLAVLTAIFGHLTSLRKKIKVIFVISAIVPSIWNVFNQILVKWWKPYRRLSKLNRGEAIFASDLWIPKIEYLSNSPEENIEKVDYKPPGIDWFLFKIVINNTCITV